jgi:diguanylate cyclase (GGDEF)-like protein
MRARLLQNPIAVATLLAAYLIAAKLGLSLAFVNPSVTAIWAPTGIALAGLLIFGVQTWPVVFAGAFLVNITTAGSIATSVALAAGNTLEALAGAYLVKRWAGGRDAFQSAQNIFRFASLIATFSTTISATVGVTVLCAAGMASWSDYPSIWMIWWLGDLTGALVICPFVMLWSMGLWGWSWRQTLKAVALIALLVLVAMVVFGGLFPSDIKNYPLEFLVVPPLMWAAFSFGRREVATALVILSGIAVWGTFHGFGPFARDTPNESFLLLQAFLCVTVVGSVALAALVTQYKHAEEQSRALAVMDPLTGLANYRRLTEMLRAEIVRSERTRRPFALLFLDLDGLKTINDREGHLAGNRALCRVAETLQRTCRKMDTAARFGGDEFVIVLPETEELGARRVAERVSAGLVTEKDDVRPSLSISAGVALYPRDGTTAAMLLSAADRVLYQEKAAAQERPSRNQLPLPLLPV